MAVKVGNLYCAVVIEQDFVMISLATSDCFLNHLFIYTTY